MIRNSRIAYGVALKPQDVMVLLKVAVWPGGAWKFADLAVELGMSASEVHKAIGRAQRSQLVAPRPDLGMWTVQRRNLLEFLIHGLRYVFPAERGALTRGVPTGIAAPILQARFGPSSEPPTVWPHAEGTARGQSIEPLYPSVPLAASRDSNLYAALAVVDAIRCGRARERAVAAEVITELLAGER